MSTVSPLVYPMEHRVAELFYNDPRGRYTVEDVVAWLGLVHPAQVSSVQSSLSRLVATGVLGYRSIRSGYSTVYKEFSLASAPRALSVLSTYVPKPPHRGGSKGFVTYRDVYEQLSKRTGCTVAHLVWRLSSKTDRYISEESAKNALSRKLRALAALGAARYEEAIDGARLWYLQGDFPEELA